MRVRGGSAVSRALEPLDCIMQRTSGCILQQRYKGRGDEPEVYNDRTEVLALDQVLSWREKQLLMQDSAVPCA